MIFSFSPKHSSSKRKRHVARSSTLMEGSRTSLAYAEASPQAILQSRCNAAREPKPRQVEVTHENAFDL
jgi:hypothetical protein